MKPVMIFSTVELERRAFFFSKETLLTFAQFVVELSSARFQDVVLVMKVLSISTLFLNYVLNELPSVSKQKLAWRKFGGANDFDCPCGKAYCSREVIE